MISPSVPVVAAARTRGHGGNREARRVPPRPAPSNALCDACANPAVCACAVLCVEQSRAARWRRATHRKDTR
eukprot:724110-Prymnesium_polylepis.2